MSGFMGPENPSQAERDRLHRLRTGTPPATRDATPAVGDTLVGYDLSSNNTAAQFADALTKPFVIIKASEGATYKNPLHDDQVAEARARGLLVAHYHFAHPDSNGPNAESAWFLKCANPQPGDLLVDDFEPPSIQPAHPSWVIAFNGGVRDATSAEGCLYTNQSQGRTLVSLAGTDQRAALFRMPLWKAYYQADIGDLMGWPTWALWQYTATPIDTNRFNGDAAAWRSLGIPQEGGMTPDQEKQLLADVAELKNIARTARRDGSTTAWPYSFTPADRMLVLLNDLTAAVKALPTTPAPSIDYAALAKAVNDDAAKRLQE